MKKKNKLPKIIAILAVIAIGFVVSCDNDNGNSGGTSHTHSWGGWQKDGTQHWKVCTHDGCTAISGDGTTESVKASHTIDDGVCTVCGYEEGSGGEDCECCGEDCECEDCPDCEECNGNDDPCADGHDESGAAATCTADKVCARPDCDYVLVAATGHTFGEATCPGCGIKYDYQLGEKGPGGGVIFYVADGGEEERDVGIYPHTRPNGFTFFQNKDDTTGIKAHYLEAAPENATGGAGGTAANMTWRVGSTNASVTSLVNITTIGTGTAAPTATQMTAINNDIGRGRKNTDLIVAFYSTHDDQTYLNAARAANNYTGGTADDWFLPGIGELYWLYQNRAQLDGKSDDGITAMPTTGVFWSSSQRSSTEAWFLSFSDGGRNYLSKGSTSPVRAVRAF